MKVSSAFSLIVCLVIFLSTGISPAASLNPIDISVDTTLDSNETSYRACTAAPNDCSLRGAISKINADFHTLYRILIPAGIYQLTIPNSTGTPEDGNNSGDLDIRSSVEIQGDGTKTTFVQAGDSAANGIDRVFHVVQPPSGTAYDVTLNGLTIRYGKVPASDAGAGINAEPYSIIHLDYMTVRDNLGVGYSFGAGIYTRSEMHIDHSIFENNVNEGEGGALYQSVSTVTIENSLFTGNSAVYGGAIANQKDMFLTNVTITGNTSQNGGGGITQWNNGNLTLTNSTVAKNTNNGSIFYWEIYNARAMTAFNSIIYTTAGKNACFTGMTAGDHNLVRAGDTSCGSIAQVTQGEPMLGNLQDNGSYPKTMAIGQNSDALDAGDNASCAAKDQRGFTRPIDGNSDGIATCDIGAFERQALTYLPIIAK